MSTARLFCEVLLFKLQVFCKNLQALKALKAFCLYYGCKDGSCRLRIALCVKANALPCRRWVLGRTEVMQRRSQAYQLQGPPTRHPPLSRRQPLRPLRPRRKRQRRSPTESPTAPARTSARRMRQRRPEETRSNRGRRGRGADDSAAVWCRGGEALTLCARAWKADSGGASQPTAQDGAMCLSWYELCPQAARVAPIFLVRVHSGDAKLWQE